MQLNVTTAPPNYVRDLAPRVEGLGEYVGNYGYALCLTHDRVRVLWDDDADRGTFQEDVDPANLTFIQSSPISASEPGAPGNDEPDERHNYEA
jgi:hypothetical protein